MTRTDPTPEAETALALKRVRWMLTGMAVFWALMVAVTLYGNTQLPAEELAQTPLWATWAVPGGVSLFCAVAAWKARAGDKTGWGLAVSAMALNLLSPLFPMAAWGVMVLFRKPVKTAMFKPSSEKV